MEDLTEDRKKILQDHQVSELKLFYPIIKDSIKRKKLMELFGRRVVVGVESFQKAGHRMRARPGHCVQCYPETLMFQDSIDKTKSLFFFEIKNIISYTYRDNK